MDTHQWNASSSAALPIGAYNANPSTFLPHIHTSPHNDPSSPEPPHDASPASQGQPAYNTDQYQTHHQPQSYEWKEPTGQPVNDAQAEYDQLQSGHTSPEDRAVLLQVLRERRRLRELELRILEERRLERDRAQNPRHQPPLPRAHSQGALYANGGAGIGIDRMALSGFGATGLSGQRDWQSLQHHPPPIYYGHDVYAGGQSTSAYDFEPGSATASTVAPSPIGTNPPSTASSVAPGFDQLPPGLGLSSSSPSSYDPYAYTAQQGQTSRSRLPSAAMQPSSDSVSPESPHQEILPHGVYGASYTNGMWDGASQTHQQHGNGVPVNIDPLHIYEDPSRRSVPQPHAPYAASTGRSSGSPYDEPSPPPSQFYPPPHVPHHAAHGPPAAAVSPTQSMDAAGKKPKKQLAERLVACRRCSQPLCKLLLRGTQEELSVPYEAVYECSRCIAPDPTSSSSGAYGSGGGGFVGSGLRLTRKRTRQTEDTSLPTVCDVCVRTIGTGGLVPIVTGSSQAGARPSVPPLTFAVEVVCHRCSGKYSRCSDCGGGSGRVGVGKWRAKELFENGRKTCRLPHVRVGGGELELSVWEVPWEINERRELGQLMDALRQLWSERVFARLAIPEVLEGGEEDWPPNGGNPSTFNPNSRGQDTGKSRIERMYRDVEDVIAKGWPARESILRTAPHPNHDHFRRYLALSWAKSRARRERAQGKMPDPAKFAAEGGQDVLMDNVRRTTALVPLASTLVGMWLVDWDMRNRTILLSTSAPFESSDAEDKNIIGVGEVLTRVMMDFEKYNHEHPEAPLKSPQHIWVATRSISALGNARMNDTLTRRRGFLPVDEYVSLHPGTDRTLFTHVPDGHAWIDEPAWIRNRQGSPSDPSSPGGDLEVLVRWLGDDIDMERLDEIKDIEYGRKSKEMQIASRSRKAQQNAASAASGLRK